MSHPDPAPESGTPAPMSPPESPSSEQPVVTHDQVVDALKQVIDPELGINIVDLGLIYTIAARPAEVDVEMTLTTPACPAGPQILRDAAAAVERLAGVTRANIKLVMSPPWSPDKMTDDARDELGIF